MTPYQRCVVVVGPETLRARFFSEWLMAVAHADKLWNQIREDNKLEEWTHRIGMAEIPDFEITAIDFIGRLSHQASFVLDLDDECGNDFVLMVGADLFTRDQNVYRMAPPFSLSREALEAVTVTYAQTEDEEYRLRPEYLINTMPRSEALAIHLRHTSTQRFESGTLWPANVTM